MIKTNTHYDHLQVSQKASPSVIRAAFKALSQKWHPDKHQHASEATSKLVLLKYNNIKQAYDVLSNPQSRQEYDRIINKQDAEKNMSDKNSKQLFDYYYFKEKKAKISIIV